MSVVIDASAVLAILNDEPGAEVALRWSRGALLSSIILSEVLAKASDQGTQVDRVHALIEDLQFVVVPFDADDAVAAARLRPATRHKRISFVDRGCLAVAMQRGLPLVTADHDWATLGLDVELRYIRERR